MSLLYHLLRSNVHHDSDDDIVPVASPGTTRPSSPALRSAAAKVKHTDPLRILPTEISQCIFARLSLRDLAGCSLVSKKWNRSQTINYVWFQHYRRENFHDASLPPGKWSKRESKQNWRVIHLKSLRERSPPSTPFSRSSSAYNSGYQTPREIREHQWRMEAQAVSQSSKLDMRQRYKELGGRKARSKPKLGSSGQNRDRGGWTDTEDW